MSSAKRNLTVEARQMIDHKGDRFTRIFFTCPMGHDMGSVPVGGILDQPWDMFTECEHYEHKGRV